MQHLIFSTVPYVMIGLCIALICVNHRKLKSQKVSEGMGVGMCIGTALGIAMAEACHLPLEHSILCAMVIGETIGMFHSIWSEKHEKQ